MRFRKCIRTRIWCIPEFDNLQAVQWSFDMLQKQLEEYKLVAILCSWTETTVTYTVGWENKWMSRAANQKCGKDWLVWGLSCRGESSNLSAFTFSTTHGVAWPHPPPRSLLYQHTAWLYAHGSGGHGIIKISINYWILYQAHSPQPLSK